MVDDLRWVSRIRVQFRDVDMLGHVNNAVYLSYLEVCRVEFYEQVFGRDGFERMPFVLGEVRVRFLAPLHLGDEVEVGVRVTRIGSKSFDYAYAIRDVATGRVVAEAESTQVFFDWRAGRSFEVPAEFREAMERLGWEAHPGV